MRKPAWHCFPPTPAWDRLGPGFGHIMAVGDFTCQEQEAVTGLLCGCLPGWEKPG